MNKLYKDNREPGEVWLRSWVFIFLFLTGILPAGTVYDVPVRNIALLILLVSLGVWVIRTKVWRQGTSMLLPVFIGIALVCFFSIWMLISLYYDASNGPTALAQWKGIVMTIIVPVLTIFLWRLKLITKNELLIVILASAVTYAFSKTLILLSVSIGVLSFDSYMDGFVHVFGNTPVTMPIGGGIYRFFNINDILVLFALYLILSIGHFQSVLSKWRWLLLFFLIFALVTAYSRAIWGLAFVLSVLALLQVEGGHERKRIVIDLMGAIMLVILTLMLLGFSLSDLLVAITSRYVGEGVVGSDNIRIKQINLLLNAFSQKQYFGWGLGAYLKEYVRATTQPFSYEVQWVAYLFQFGVVGLLTIMWSTTLIPRLGLVNGISRKWWLILAAYLLWLLMPFTNPYLGNSVAGLVFALFSMLFIDVNKYRMNSAAKRQTE